MHYTLYINFVLIIIFMKHFLLYILYVQNSIKYQQKLWVLKTVMVIKFGTNAIVLPTTGWFYLLFDDQYKYNGFPCMLEYCLWWHDTVYISNWLLSKIYSLVNLSFACSHNNIILQVKDEPCLAANVSRADSCSWSQSNRIHFNGHEGAVFLYYRYNNYNF